jgi:hypothetical protein
MAAGDRLVVYLGGSRPGARSFYAIAEVASRPLTSKTKIDAPDGNELEGHQPASSWLPLKDVRWFQPRVAIREVLGRLSFAPKTHNRWGVAFMSGVRVLSDADWDLIVSGRELNAAP